MEKNKIRRFYDIHYHMFNLSHPNLLAFLLRDDLINTLSVRKVLGKLPFILKVLPVWVLRFFSKKVAEKLRVYIKNDAGKMLNLLSVMEGAVEYHFLYNEYFLLRGNGILRNGNDLLYNKIVICPLIMDFGYKGYSQPDCFYNLPPAKPVVRQVVDLLDAIYFYYNYDLIVHPDKPGKYKLIPSLLKPQDKLFEIYPFLGLNTSNYDLTEIAEMFDKYFRGYEDDISSSDRHGKLFSKLGKVRAGLEDMIFRIKEKSDPDYFTYLFAGIKLYPPLGFDPWPSDNPCELEKVRFLYSECIRKKLPITVHCSDGGFKTSSDSEIFTDPSVKWEKVLSQAEFRNLKINFAHMGSQKNGKTEWQKKIFEFIDEGRNVYTDCSCITPQMNDYKQIADVINDKNISNMLFGTDFIINLIWADSYNGYLNNFMKSPFLTDSQKELICEINPEKFLFG